MIRRLTGTATKEGTGVIAVQFLVSAAATALDEPFYRLGWICVLHAVVTYCMEGRGRCLTIIV